MDAMIARSPAVFSQPTILTGLSGTNNLATSARPLVRVSASTTASVVVASGRSHLITNAGTIAITVTTTGNAGYTLNVGDSVLVAWNGTGSAHVLSALSSQGGTGTTSTSTNLVHTAHGRVTGEIGRPLSGKDLFVDTAALSWPTAILMNVPDTNTLTIAKTGDVVTLPVALLVNGAAFNVSLGRKVWFDYSATLYKQAREPDALIGLGAQLYVLSVSASTFTAVVLPMVPVPLRKIPEYTLTEQNITDKQCGLLTAGLAIDAMVWFNGTLVSSLDASFNSLTGVLSWNGLGLDGQALAGMRVQGLFEPL